jgi:isocitrate lyase
MDKLTFVADLEHRWQTDARWRGITRPYSAEDVWRLRGTVDVGAGRGAEGVWQIMHRDAPTAVLSAVTGNQAIQQVRAGLEAIYLSGWQVAGDMNTAGEVYPDQSLYPADSAPALVRRLNNALLRADQVHHERGDDGVDWLVPIVADAEAGFGGLLNAFELVKHLIEAGAAAVHLEDQLASLKKCGHLGGKVLVPTSEFINKLVAARLAADICNVDTVLIARTDALSASILANDIDPYDGAFVTGERTPEGFAYVRSGIEQAIARGLAYAPYADALWFETSKPDLDQARRFADAIHAQFPGKLLAYNCSPSFNWKRNLSSAQITSFQDDLGALGYKFQFVTLAGFHVINYAMFDLATQYRKRGMAAYATLQEREFAAEAMGYEAVKHQQFVGAGYFDDVTQAVTRGRSSVLAMLGSTEEEQFREAV